MRKSLSWFVLAFGALGVCLSARAQGPTPMAQWQLSPGVQLVPYLVEEIPKWRGVVGLGVVALPTDEGARQNRLIPIAAAELRYRDIAYASSSEGIGFNFLRGKSYRIGAALGYDIGRAEKRDPRLNGLGDLEAAPEVRLYAEKVLFPLVLRSTLLHTLADEAGWLADFAFYLPVVGGRTLLVLAGPSVTLADGDAMRRRFGVTAGQSARAGLPQYSPGAGFRNAALGFSATWLIDESWFVNATGSAQKLIGPAADSPLIERETQLALLLAGGYRW